MIYQFVWTHKNADGTERALPMLWHGRHLQRMGWSNPIVLVFLEGLNHLSRDYRQQLAAVGYEIFDGSSLARELIREAHPLLRRIPVPDKYWFLRWVIVGHLWRQSGDTTAVHMDTDVVLMADPRELRRDVDGKTFVLEGNPHFTVLSRADWFDIYRRELNTFLQHQADYVAIALRAKENPLRPDRSFCNVCAYERGRFADQDFIEYLIASGRLPQARTEEVFDSRYYWVQNPLLPGEWFEEQCGLAERQIIEKGTQSFVGGKQLAFYHFQSAFVDYCARWLALYQAGAEHTIDAHAFLRDVRRVSPVWSVMARVAKLLGFRGMRERRAVYQQCFQPNPRTGNLTVTDIANSCWP